jgi:hypothetical protein
MACRTLATELLLVHMNRITVNLPHTRQQDQNTKFRPDPTQLWTATEYSSAKANPEMLVVLNTFAILIDTHTFCISESPFEVGRKFNMFVFICLECFTG